jgi:crossover junction endodeoxyribonuclease RuvC
MKKTLTQQLTQYMQKERRILGIDPGYDRCGVAIVEGKMQSPKLVFSCCIETNKKKTFAERIEFIFNALNEIIHEHQPNEAAVEDLFFTTNQKTAIKVAEARGICLLAAQKNKLKIGEYTPLQIKTYLTSYGKADKKQVHFIVEKILEKNKENVMNNKKVLDDEVDAIAIALTHLFVGK